MKGFVKKGGGGIKHVWKRPSFMKKKTVNCLLNEFKSLREYIFIFMKYIGQVWVFFLDYTNIPNFHTSSHDGNKKSKKKNRK